MGCKIPQSRTSTGMTLCLSLSFSHNSFFCVFICVFFHQEVKSLVLACSKSNAESFPLQLRTGWSDSTKVNPRFCCTLFVPSLITLSFHSAFVTDSGLVRPYKNKRDFLAVCCRPLSGKERKSNITFASASRSQEG